MNKASEILNSWISEKKAHLKILIDRRDSEKHWSGVEGKEDYFLPRYQSTKFQVETMEREIIECEQALILLNENIGPTEQPNETAAV